MLPHGTRFVPPYLGAQLGPGGTQVYESIGLWDVSVVSSLTAEYLGGNTVLIKGRLVVLPLKVECLLGCRYEP